MTLENLRDLFVEQLEDLYDAEQQLVKALPKMAKSAQSPKLKSAFENHLRQTEGHVTRLEQVFKQLDMKPKAKTCKAMKGLVEEGSEAIKENAEPEVKDAALIAAANRVEHYEMAGYGTVRTYAQTLGYTEAARILQTTLDEEGEADKILTNLAETSINKYAQQGTSSR
jgi:ferritin-like metal-binding protein YciE